MKIKILYPNENGKLEFSKTELEKLLTEAYNEGFADGKKVYPHASLTYPSYTYTSVDCASAKADTSHLNGVTYANANTNVDADALASASNVTVDDVSTLLRGA